MSLIAHAAISQQSLTRGVQDQKMIELTRRALIDLMSQAGV